jgi:hypothetical protein
VVDALAPTVSVMRRDHELERFARSRRNGFHVPTLSGFLQFEPELGSDGTEALDDPSESPNLLHLLGLTRSHWICARRDADCRFWGDDEFN